MKIKIIVIATLMISSLYSHNAKAQDYQDLQDYYAPIEFNGPGMQSFFKNVFNTSGYVHELLPCSFRHFFEFIDHGIQTKQSRVYVEYVVKLFKNKAKALECINPSTLEHMLERMNIVLKPYVQTPKIDLFQQHKETVHQLLYQNFLERFDLFKKEPKIFLDDLAQTIVQQVTPHSTDNEVSIEQLQQTTTCFLEVVLNKLIWSPDDKELTWTSVKSIATQLEKLMNNNIIASTDDMDDLCWTLVHRYSYFLKLAGSYMPLDVLAHIKNDIVNQDTALFSVEEQEEFMTTKAEHLTQTIRYIEAQALAQEKGIITT